MPTHDTPTARRTRQRAGVFDIRTIIALLLGIYGVVLTLTGLFATSQQDLAKAGGINLNLWTGTALLASSALFFAWARLRPVVVPAGTTPADERNPS
ncbi:MAG: hypothetical protein M3165_07685 [Actinomycetota bacterium]|nr:hypothetical protein [Actinomycetota bacterium]